MEIAHNNEEERMRDLYNASQKGCVSTLNTLLQLDPLILQRVSSQTTFFETPLHISALLGHLEFTKTLLAHCPKLALELDSSRRTPLHLASAQGHIHIVKELLPASGETCLVRDQERRIPLHYAVIRGRREVALELIRAKPESLRLPGDDGQNIFHLCVMHNQLEILRDLVALDTHDTNELLIEGDLDGNTTILHLAIMLKQVETVRYLISIPKIRSEASNLKNDMGYTAPEMVHRIPKDSKSLEIRAILMESEIKCGRTERIDAASNEYRRGGRKKFSWGRVLRRIDQWLIYHGNWVEDMRGNLSLAATVMASITFPAAINPPGSVIQQGIRPGSSNVSLPASFNTSIDDGPLGCLPYQDNDGFHRSYGPCPGDAMLAYRRPNYFGQFILYNTISFVASMIVVLLLVSGAPLRHIAVMRVLSLGMTIAVTCLLNAYFSGLILVGSYTMPILYTITAIFNFLQVMVFIYIFLISVRWARKKVKEFTKHPKSSDQGTRTGTANV